MSKETNLPKAKLKNNCRQQQTPHRLCYLQQTPSPFSPAEMKTQSKPHEDFHLLEESSLAAKLHLSFYEGHPQFTLTSPRRIREGSPNKKLFKTKQLQRSIRELGPGDAVGKKKAERQRIKNVVNLADLMRVFQDKLTRNSVHRKPVSFDLLENSSLLEESKPFYVIDKMPVPQAVQNAVTFCKVIYIIIYYFLFPLSLLFDEVSYSLPMVIVKALGLCFCLVDILEILQTTHLEDVKHRSYEQSGGENTWHRNSLIVQGLVILAVVASIVMTEYQASLGSLMFVAMAVNIRKYQKEINNLESEVVTATHYEKYFDLVKIVLMNLLICHLLACFLISITYLNYSETWMTQANIVGSPWYEQYVWSYYFGTTIILTIGFGDLHAANHVEAFFIISISFFACVFFGYNINYIGHLINSIRQDELEKVDKLKVFSNLAKKTQVTSQLKNQIKNYIIQESNIKKVSNYAQEKKLLQELPLTLKSSFLQEANKQLFNQLLTIVRLTKRTVENLSQNIQTKICHPQEVIKRAWSQPSLIILQSGEVGFSTRIPQANKLNNIVLERINSEIQSESKLVCVDAISRQKLSYDIKSLAYSIIYFMDGDTFDKTLRQSKDDYQMYKHLQDKCRYTMSQFSVTVCRFCSKKHTLFECPRLHFIPFRNIIPAQYHKRRPSDKQPRVKILRHKKPTAFEFTGNGQSKEEGNIQDYYLEDLCHLNPRIFGKALQKNGDKIQKGVKRSTKRSSYMQTRDVVTQIRDELSKLKKQEAQFEFTLWSNCDCDLAHDFSYYFPHNNPSRLSQKKVKVTLEHLSISIRRRNARKQTDALISTF